MAVIHLSHHTMKHSQKNSSPTGRQISTSKSRKMLKLSRTCWMLLNQGTGTLQHSYQNMIMGK
ncbi:hypothetical protein DPMN_083218 [Dreissena polymorpha]|uniref:Uncharacterized protein n=1 Tax=Dreissena polymorpha TaxID=45954 RepID=A0A9D3YC77_DREPO|nr:hypothetical protein DPMN_083218 [Dreissena polymorpha]